MQQRPETPWALIPILMRATVATIPMIPSVTSVDLRAAPIEPSWIRKGNPLARNATLSRSADGLASTLVWDCTAGEFQWIYEIDETIYFLEGSATISDGHNPPKTFGPGDVLFLPRGPCATGMSRATSRRSPSAVAPCRRRSASACGLSPGSSGW